ncbi:defensin, beta-like 2 [Astyanax mexicanus]|uniref:Defensin, beta-like 2 n=1 Tax=Astyanax mexicanus TaxID=7994 RepID=A0A8B9JGH7_ASTMX|nr:defensin, beta-like 2 [Astyanax mexicanus]
MSRLALILFVLLMVLSAGNAEDTEAQYWTCGYRGLCRRFCFAQEYIVGHHGCPRRYRYFTYFMLHRFTMGKMNEQMHVLYLMHAIHAS